MSGGVVGVELVERERELAELGDLVHAARGGRGSVVVVEAPAGQGKTALLRALRALAVAEGCRLLTATGASLEQEFAFGLVRQLFEPVLHDDRGSDAERLFAGAADLARAVFDLRTTDPAAGDVSHARLHGLFWLTANLADEAPLVLAIDDLHWGDRASLRFLDVLARRVEDLPVLLAVAARPAEPVADQDLIDELSMAPAAVVLRPTPLSREGVAALVERALGGVVAAEFVGAAAELTAGNALLVRELTRTLVAEGFRGRADEVPAARRAVPPTITRSVVRRLRRLSPDALAFARGLAVLGDRAAFGRVAALAELELPAARAAHATLIRVGLVDAEHLAFQHPLVQEAVAADLVGAERSSWHRRAAHRVAGAGATMPEVAAHLMRADPEGDGWAASVLAEAGRKATGDGAPEAGARLLRRALAEPPAPEDVPQVRLALGVAAAATGAPDAIAHLDAAVASGDPVTAARAAAARCHQLVLVGRADEAADSLRRPMEAVAPVDPALADELADLLLDALPYGANRLDAYVREVEASAARGRAAGLAHLCWVRAATGAPAPDVLGLARRALADGRLVHGVMVERFAPLYLVEALDQAECADEAAAVLTDLREEARRAGSRAGMTALAFMQPQWDRRYGDLRRAEGDLREALDHSEALHVPAARDLLRAMLVSVLADRGDLEGAERVAAQLPPVDDPLLLSAGVHAVRGRLRLEQGRPAEALAAFERFAQERPAGRLVTPREPTRPLAVRALTGLGRRTEARVLADEELADAQRRGTAGAEARIRLARAQLLDADGAGALDELRLAVDAARRSPLRLARAEALMSLGGALRRAGRRAEARDPLREARELAHACGATGLERRAHDELVVAGARPQRVALSGLDALTAAERRVAELAAQGLRNRDIAETLFVTHKTVEVHLGHVYAKLGIQNRSQLADALAPA